MYLASYSGLQVRLNNGPWLNWSESVTPSDPDITALAVHGQTIWVGAREGVYRSLNAGHTFTAVNIAPGRLFVSEIQIDDQRVALVTRTQGLMLSSDGGGTWVSRGASDGLVGFPMSVHAVGNRVIVGTSDGHAAISTDGGATFRTFNANNGALSDSAYAVLATPSRFYVGTGTGLHVSDDDGNSWTTRSTAPGLPNNGVRCLFQTPDNVLVVCGLSALGVSFDAGESFSVRRNGLPCFGGWINKVLVRGDVWWVGTSTLLYRSLDAGANFEPISGTGRSEITGLAVMGDRLIVSGTWGVLAALSPMQ